MHITKDPIVTCLWIHISCPIFCEVTTRCCTQLIVILRVSSSASSRLEDAVTLLGDIEFVSHHDIFWLLFFLSSYKA